MRSVNMLEAKTDLSRLLESRGAGREDEIVIARLTFFPVLSTNRTVRFSSK